MSDALALASAAATAGTTTLVATPHIDHQWHVRPELIPRLAAALRAEMRNEGIELELRTSGEVALSRLADLTNEQKRALRLGDGPYLLLESPLTPLAGDFDLLLGTVLRRGESVVLAHPERSPASGGRSSSASPWIRSASRLVANSLSAGTATTSSASGRAAPGRRCARVSHTISPRTRTTRCSVLPASPMRSRASSTSSRASAPRANG